MPIGILNRHNLNIFLWVFSALNVVFAYYHAVFFWGNHDWDWVKGTTQVLSLNTGMFEGRYAKFILNVVLFGGQVLPLLNTIIAFALLAIGQVLLVNYWDIKTQVSRILTALIPVLSPFILGWLFFPINILGNFVASPLVIGGLILAKKNGIKNKITAIICFLTALGVYPCVMEMIIICWLARQIMVPTAKIKQILPSLLVILISLVMFKMLLFGLEKAGLVYMGHYNMQTVSLAKMIKKIPQMLILIADQLTTSLPFFPLKLKVVGLSIILLSVLVCIRTKKTAFFWLMMAGTTVLSTFLTAKPAETAYMPRVNFYGLNYFYTAAIAIILNQKKIYKNLGLILSIFYLLLSINQNFEAQKVWHFGKTAEENLIERISSRIKEQNPHLPLTAVIAGEMPLRPRYYTTPYTKPSPYLLNTALMVRHIPSGMFNFYASIPVVSKNSQISTITPKLYDYLKKVSEPWPAQEGIYIDENYVIVLLTKEGIKAIKAQLP